MPILTDPTLELVFDCFNPGPPIQIFIDGSFRKDDENIYFRDPINVPTFVAGPTQFVHSVYYDSIESVNCWRGITPAGTSAVFVHCYLRQGGLSNDARFFSLFSGWISDANSISYPPVSRVDTEEPLCGSLARVCTVAPAPIMSLTPLTGMPFKIVGFRGTFTCSANIANRNIGLGVDDGAGVFFELSVNATNFPAGSVVTVTGCSPEGQPQTFGTLITIPLPDLIIANPRRFIAFVNNVQALDAWSNCSAIIRPFVDF